MVSPNRHQLYLWVQTPPLGAGGAVDILEYAPGDWLNT